MNPLVSELREKRTLADEGLRELLESEDASLVESLHRSAREVAVQRFGKQVWLGVSTLPASRIRCSTSSPVV